MTGQSRARQQTTGMKSDKSLDYTSWTCKHPLQMWAKAPWDLEEWILLWMWCKINTAYVLWSLGWSLWYVNNVSLSYILVPSVFNYRVPWPQEKTPCFFKLEFQIHPGARAPNKKTVDSASALLSMEGIESGFEEGENTNNTDWLFASLPKEVVFN